jgi:hypothetical protein
MAKMIDGKTYNKITALCDRLVFLNNALAYKNSDVSVAWDVFCDGIFSMSIINVKNEHPCEVKEWFFRNDKDNAEYNSMIEQINEWETKYALA